MFPANWGRGWDPGLNVRWDVEQGALVTWRLGWWPTLRSSGLLGLPDGWMRVPEVYLASLAAAARAARRWEPHAGIRVWNTFGGYLRGLRADTAWRSRMTAVCIGWRSRMTAVCIERDHPAPQRTCGCGLYAVRPTAHRELAVWPTSAVGVVSLFGRVVEHQHGWRAQYARIREVWIDERAFRSIVLDAYPGVTWHTWEWDW